MLDYKGISAKRTYCVYVGLQLILITKQNLLPKTIIKIFKFLMTSIDL
jgi:hypothetical protein